MDETSKFVKLASFAVFVYLAYRISMTLGKANSFLDGGITQTRRLENFEDRVAEELGKYQRLQKSFDTAVSFADKVSDIPESMKKAALGAASSKFNKYLSDYDIPESMTNATLGAASSKFNKYLSDYIK